MKIELKNLKINLEFSQETTMFRADLYVDGKKVAECKNDGLGGSTDIYAYPNMYEMLKKTEDYCKTLPPYIFESGLTLDMDLSMVIDDLVEKFVNERELKKHLKKLEKNCLKGICYGTTDCYHTLTWKNHTIESLLKIPKGRTVIQLKLKELINEGKDILNKNIPQELFPNR